MHRTLLVLALAASGLAALPASAQSGPPRWSAGLGTMVSDSPYAGEGQRVRLFPYLAWEGERAYLRGPDLGLRLWLSGPMRVDVALSARLDGFEARDLGRRELAANGIDRALLDDRSDSVDAALSATWSGESLEFKAEARQDIAGASEGSELRLRLGLPQRAGAWRWTPYVQARWLSSDLADYYYGLSDREVQRGLPAYRPGSAWQPEAGLGLFRGFRSGWFTVASLRLGHLPGALADSPLIESRRETSLFMAIGRGF